MVVSANHFKDVTNGYERTTDGLWVHRGKMSVGPVGTAPALAGDLNVNRGNGTGALYFAGSSSKYIFYDGANWVFSPVLTSAALAPGAASALLGSYVAPNGYSTTTTGVWLTTTVTTGSIACSGATVRIDCSVSMYHSLQGGAFYTALHVDSAHAVNLTYAQCPNVQYTMPISWTYYYTPAAGNHTFALGVYNATAGTLTINGATYATLFVTEQRR